MSVNENCSNCEFQENHDLDPPCSQCSMMDNRKPNFNWHPKIDVSQHAPTPNANSQQIGGAEQLLHKAAETLLSRGKDYDKPKGERSMKATVRVFNEITGGNMKESEGWLFMCALKQVRAFTGEKNHGDSMLDLIAYSALMAESSGV